MTFGEIMNRNGFTRGFDYLRLILAAGVILWHSVFLSGDIVDARWALSGIPGALKASVLPMFFSLSGFLVAGSLLRARTLPGFAALRIIRLVPALAVEVMLSALVIGPLLTNRDLSAYVADSRFRAYFLNIIGYIHYELPGVFTTNPRPDYVNLSLWTVPFELECYLVLIVIALLGGHRNRGLFALGTIGATLALAAYYAFGPNGGPASALTMTMPGRGLVLSFLCGVMLYLYREKMPFRWSLIAVSAVAGLWLVSYPQTMVLAVLPFAYLVAALGLTHPPRSRLMESGDYSYGMYLFAFPIQQMLAMTPLFRPWLPNFIAAILCSGLYAALSWHLVEKPVLARKKHIVGLVETVCQHIVSAFMALRPGRSRP